MDPHKTYALITGASRGLGKAFAFELVKRKINIILVALPDEGLNELSAELKVYEVDVQIYETDLTVKQNVMELTRWVNNHFDVFMLINNAGRGGTRRFSEVDADYLNDIIQLNIMALSLITHELLPNLMKQKSAYILNISSLASFSPTGYKTVYPASKAFVYNFTRGLYQELKHTNVFVSVALPGPLNTNGDVKKRLNRQGWLGRLAVTSPKKMAAVALHRLFNKEQVIVVGSINRLMRLLLKILPTRIKLPIMTWIFIRELNTQSK